MNHLLSTTMEALILTHRPHPAITEEKLTPYADMAETFAQLPTDIIMSLIFYLSLTEVQLSGGGHENLYRIGDALKDSLSIKRYGRFTLPLFDDNSDPIGI